MSSRNSTLQGLVSRARGRDSEAFADLVELTQDRLLRRVCRLGFQHADAEEIVFEAYRLAWIKMTLLRDESRFEGWISVIARRMALERRKKLLREKQVFETLEEGASLEQRERDSDVEQPTADRDEVDRLLSGLSRQDRELLEDKFLKKLTLAEIAARSGLKIHQITYRLGRLKAKLGVRWKGRLYTKDEDQERHAPGREN